MPCLKALLLEDFLSSAQSTEKPLWQRAKALRRLAIPTEVQSNIMRLFYLAIHSMTVCVCVQMYILKYVRS